MSNWTVKFNGNTIATRGTKNDAIRAALKAKFDENLITEGMEDWIMEVYDPFGRVVRTITKVN